MFPVLSDENFNMSVFLPLSSFQSKWRSVSYSFFHRQFFHYIIFIEIKYDILIIIKLLQDHLPDTLAMKVGTIHHFISTIYNKETISQKCFGVFVSKI